MHIMKWAEENVCSGCFKSFTPQTDAKKMTYINTGSNELSS